MSLSIAGAFAFFLSVSAAESLSLSYFISLSTAGALFSLCRYPPQGSSFFLPLSSALSSLSCFLSLSTERLFFLASFICCTITLSFLLSFFIDRRSSLFLLPLYTVPQQLYPELSVSNPHVLFLNFIFFYYIASYFSYYMCFDVFRFWSSTC